MSFNSTEHSAHNGHNFVTHIRDLLPLPRHAIFHVKLVIHQLQSVPLITGEFRIKWKFKHLQAVNSAGRPLGLGRALALKIDGPKKRHSESANGKGKGKEVVNGGADVGNENEMQETIILPTPAPASYGHRPDSAHSEYSRSKQSTSSSTSNSNSRLDETPLSEENGIDYRSETRGYTPFHPLRNFNVDFESEINVAVQMSIDRDALALLPSEFKLTVMQRVIPHDPEAPLNPRLGHVQVNLAEYATAGPVTRNYLLRRSKVNAMLNMTITMSQISGEENYIAPPLRKEEIKAGISDFLSVCDVPLPALSRHMPTDDPWVSSSLDGFLQQDDDTPDESGEPMDIALEVPERESRSKKRWRVVGNGKRGASAGRSKTLDAPPPVPKTNGTARKQQLHPTEALIEAIFNPYPSTSVSPSPFTYYVPPPLPPPKPQKQDSIASEGHGTDGTSRGSFDSSQRASASEHGHDGGSSGGSGSGSKWWKRKPGSRPVTPARMNSTRS